MWVTLTSSTAWSAQKVTAYRSTIFTQTVRPTSSFSENHPYGTGHQPGLKWNPWFAAIATQIATPRSRRGQENLLIDIDSVGAQHPLTLMQPAFELLRCKPMSFLLIVQAFCDFAAVSRVIGISQLESVWNQLGLLLAGQTSDLTFKLLEAHAKSVSWSCIICNSSHGQYL